MTSFEAAPTAGDHPAYGCPAQDCDHSKVAPIDVYCYTHDRFLPLATDSPSRLRPVAAFAWRAGICWAFLLAAQSRSALPVFLAVAVVGCAVVVLPLRHFVPQGLAALAGWVVAGVTALLLRSADPGIHQAVWTLLLTAAVGAGVIQLGRVAFAMSEDLSGPAGALVATVFAVAPGSLLIFAASALVPGSLSPLSGARIALLACAAGAGAVAFLIAVLGSALRTVDVTLPYQHGPIREPRPPVPLRRPARRMLDPVVGRDLGSLVLRALQGLAWRVQWAAMLTALAVADGVLRLLYWLRVFLVWLVNWLCRWARALGAIVADASRLVVSGVRQAVRFVIVPVAALVTAAWAATGFAESVLAYLLHGPLASLAALLGLGVGTWICLTIAWVALAGLPMATSVGSAWRFASIAGANGLLLVVVGGWVVGLFGTFGYGPVRVGWVTLSSTLIVITASAWAYLNKRRAAGRTRVPPIPVAGVEQQRRESPGASSPVTP